MIKKYTVISPDGSRYPATKWSVACEIASGIVKAHGSAEIEVKLSREESA